MRHEDIETIFSAKVAELIANGYRINASTMGGSQGEIAKVDLRRGKEILRILLHHYPVRDEDHLNYEAVTLTVGRNTDRVLESHPFSSYDTIWNQNLEPVEERTFYRIDTDADYFSEDREEIRAQVRVRYARWNARRSANAELNLTKAQKIVLPFIRRQPGCKSKKESDIQRVGKAQSGYAIHLTNGKTFWLAARKCSRPTAGRTA